MIISEKQAVVFLLRWNKEFWQCLSGSSGIYWGYPQLQGTKTNQLLS